MMAVEKGSYALIMALERDASIAIGRLGQFIFPAGYYAYCGSAHGGLRQRVTRHLRGHKRLRWHIDYLLQHATVTEVWYAVGDERAECRWASTMQDMPRARVVVPRFGSSDCRCRSHLIHFPRPPSFRIFRQRLGEPSQRLRRASPRRFLSAP